MVSAGEANDETPLTDDLLSEPDVNCSLDEEICGDNAPLCHPPPRNVRRIVSGRVGYLRVVTTGGTAGLALVLLLCLTGQFERSSRWLASIAGVDEHAASLAAPEAAVSFVEMMPGPPSCKHYGCQRGENIAFHCQCNAGCGLKKNCCPDFQPLCSKWVHAPAAGHPHHPPPSHPPAHLPSPPAGPAPLPPSCKKYGCQQKVNWDFRCQCNGACFIHKNCCPDYKAVCSNAHPAQPAQSTTRPWPPPHAAPKAAIAHVADTKQVDSCQKYGCQHGENTAFKCQCDAYCPARRDCCQDYKAKCGWQTTPAPPKVTTPAPPKLTTPAKPTAPPCHTTKKGEKCWDGVIWVHSKGIAKHPDWYKGLGPNSFLEEIQQRLFELKEQQCAKPCLGRTKLPAPPPAKKPWGHPSVFCFSVARAGYEMDIMRMQIQKGAGIFACDEQAVLSDSSIDLGNGVKTIVFGQLGAGVGRDGTAANTQIFVNAWNAIGGDGRFKSHEFVVKADPDAVVVPDRLRAKVAGHAGQNVYFQNCDLRAKYPGSTNFPMMYGALEVYTREAVQTFIGGFARCQREMWDWANMGEDAFMGECLKRLGTGPVGDFSLLQDERCWGVDCNNKGAAAYHAFKNPAAWLGCWTTAMR